MVTVRCASLSSISVLVAAEVQKLAGGMAETSKEIDERLAHLTVTINELND